MKIYKFTLVIAYEQRVSMPKGAKILSVQFQGERLCMWAMVNEDSEHVMRTIVILGTGNAFSEAGTLAYVGTVQEPPFVWHVFERLDHP